MKIPIDIRVRMERVTPDPFRKGEEVSEKDDFLVSGTLKKTKTGLRVEYTEDSNATTTIIDAFKDNTISVNRIGPVNTHMVFSDKDVHTCIFNTGFYPMQMQIYTKNLKNSLTMDGGKIEVDYTVEIVGNLAERSKISFSVSPDVSIIKS